MSHLQTSKANLKTDPSFKQFLHKRMAGHLGALVGDVREFLESCVTALKKHAGIHREVVMLVDSIERFRGTFINAQIVQSSVEELFVGHSERLRLPRLHVVYTIPPYLKIRYGNLGALYEPGGVHMLSALKLRNRDEERFPHGYDVMERVVRERGDWQKLLGERAVLDHLIEKSAGHLRDLLRLLAEVLRRAKELPVSGGTVDSAIDQMRTKFLPNADDDAKWLTDTARSHQTALPTAAVLRRRTGQILKFQARRFRVIRPGSPEEFGNVLPALFESQSSHAGCVWVESIHADSTTPEAGAPGDWTLAWDRFFLRANKRRDSMRRHLGGGLILAAPPEVKPRARDAAPDLWSVRSLVLDLRPSNSDSGSRVNRDSHVTRKIRAGPEYVPSDSTVDVEFSLAEAERVIRRIKGKPDYRVHGPARILLRAVEGLLERGASQQAFDVARKTAELLRGRSDAEPLLADALSSLGRAARAENDVAVASESLEESLALRRGLLDRYGETPESLRDLSISLGRVGDVRRASGELSAATAAYEESLALGRRLLEGYGETPESLRDLSISLGRVGDVRRASGELSAATAAYEESLALDRRLLEGYEETPESLRDLSVGLERLGDIRREAGESGAAVDAYEAALALRHAAVGKLGQPPPRETLLELTRLLDKLEHVVGENGDRAALESLGQERQAIEKRLAATARTSDTARHPRRCTRPA